MRDPYKIVDHGKEAMDAAIELQGKIANPRPNSLNKFGWVYKTKDGEIKIVNRGNQACYADLMENWKPKGAKALYFVDWANHWYKPGLEGNILSKELALEFAKWVANSSVWRRAFVVKDPEALISAPAIFHTAHPIRFVVQAAMTMRYIYEKQLIIEMWGELKKHVDAHAAFFLAHHVIKDWKNPKLFVNAGPSGHAIFDSGDCNDSIIMHSLVKRNFSFMKGMHSTYEKAWGYRVLEKTWGPASFSPLIYPPFDLDRADGNWGGRVRGWNDLGKFAKETVAASMEVAIKELAKLDAKKQIPSEKPEEADKYAPDGPYAEDEYYDGDGELDEDD